MNKIELVHCMKEKNTLTISHHLLLRPINNKTYEPWQVYHSLFGRNENKMLMWIGIVLLHIEVRTKIETKKCRCETQNNRIKAGKKKTN